MNYHEKLLGELRDLRSKHSGSKREYETLCDAVRIVEKVVAAQPKPGTVRVKIAVSVIAGTESFPDRTMVLCESVDGFDDEESALIKIRHHDGRQIAHGFIEADIPLIPPPPTVPGRPVDQNGDKA